MNSKTQKDGGCGFHVAKEGINTDEKEQND